jgi:hypothetical protein
MCFDQDAKKLGFGCMRLPKREDDIDTEQFKQMIDTFLAEGFCYFDTAHMYVQGKSETALRECLVNRYPRDQFILTDKLSTQYFEREEEIRPLFETQLQCCGVDYFDFYLMHAQTATIYEKFRRCHAYEIALELLKEGKIRHFGLSFHDKAEVLDQILSDYPQIEVVQIQFNYIDYDDPSVESRKCYEVCRKHKKPMIIMEPVKGGSLANVPEEGKKIFAALEGGSPASYAIRYAAGFDGVVMVLSGMSNQEQLEENLQFMKDFQPLSEKELRAVEQVRDIIRSQDLISCTACAYCVGGCPKQIAIPDLFACLNAKKQYQDWNSDYYYHVHTANNGKASSCIGCGKCEVVCPQHLPIRSLLSEAAAIFETEE